MRWIHALSVSIVLMIGLASTATAQVSLFVTPRDATGAILLPGAPLVPGTQISFEVAARKDATGIVGLGVSAVEYDLNGLAFSSGVGLQQLFADICLAGVGCFGGLDGSNSVSGPLFERYRSGLPRVQIFDHISLTPATETGELDWGPNGIPGEPQARLVFDVVSGGVFQQGGTISIGAFFSYGDAVVLPTGGYGTAETIWVVPEPGTAVMTGLGLGLLARSERRRSRRPASSSAETS